MSPRRDLTETERLHAHIRRELADRPWLIPSAIAAADAIHLDGLGHMQTALDAALATELPQKAAA